MSNDIISLKHEKMCEEVKFPQWIKDIRCPFCQTELNHRSVRKVILNTNTRNFGDISVEVFCYDCGKMDTVYFRGLADNMDEFINYLKDKKPESDCIVEEDMYKMQYNNVVEKYGKVVKI